MRHLRSLVLSAFLSTGLCAPTVLADSPRPHVTDAELKYDDDAVTVELTATQPLGKPRVRTRRGQVRVWFPRLRDHLRFQLDGDGSAVKQVQVRPGAGTTYLVHVRLGDRRKLDPSVVQVLRDGRQARIRIPLRSLAPVRSTPPVGMARKPTPQDTSASTTSTTSPERAVLPSANHDGQEVENPRQAALAKLPTRKRTTSSGSAVIANAATPGLNVPALIGISAALLVLLAALKLVQRARVSGERRPVIDVVASRRIGPGHQLMIVRAFGKDHLLSVNGKTTERIASEPAAHNDASPSPPGSALPSKGALLSRLMPPVKPMSDDLDLAGDSLTPKPDFGDELLKLARGASRTPAAARNSESVAGLLRLRERVGRG